MIRTDIEAEYGRCLTASELAQFLHLDRRTVIKYALRWGGVEVAPGTWRFFENKIMEAFNAEHNSEKRNFPVQSKRDSSRADTTKTVLGREQKVISGRSDLGKRNKKRDGEEAIPDKFGIFGDRSMVQ